MRFRAVKMSIAVISLCFIGAQAAAMDTTALQTIINNIKANTGKIASYYAEFTIKEDSLKADSTHACKPRNITWEFSRPDTVIFSIQKGTGWIHHNSILGGNGEEFPKYEAIVMLNILADTFPNSWINLDIPTFTATVLSEDNDSIVLKHMNSSVFFNYTVDKKRWVVTRVVASAYDTYDAHYTWSSTAGGIYYPSAMKITGRTDLCDSIYPLANIKVVAALSVVPRYGKAAASGSNVVSIALTQAPGEKVFITLPYGENVRGVSITDVSGRLVQNLRFTAALATDRAFLWDGKGQGSRQVRPGVYFVTISTDRSQVSAKLPLVK